MFQVICFLALATLASSAHLGVPMIENNPLLSNRIVGGQPISITQTPYQVSLQIDTFHTCGGSILNSNHILTAGHCVPSGSNQNNLYIRVGSDLNNNGGQRIKVDGNGIYVHPNYDPNKHWTNDMAIMRLTSNIQIDNYYTKPVGLPSLRESVPINNYAIASGWGRLTEGGILPTQLQGVQIPINDPSVCEYAYGTDAFNRDTMVCAASTAGGHSTCQGDSGGPLVANGKQWGIVSWAQGCARPNYPTVFGHVANLRQFITNTVGI